MSRALADAQCCYERAADTGIVSTMRSALYFLIAAKRCEIAGLHQLALTSTLVHAISLLVHALQRERGLSNLYLGSQGAQWLPAHQAQTDRSDVLQASLLLAFERLDTETSASSGSRLFARIAYVLQGMDALPALRQRVVARQCSASWATAAYIRLIAGLMAVVFEAADGANDPDISRHLVALFHFMQGKEFTGQERAVGAALFAAGSTDVDAQQRLSHLIESQERCLQVFSDFSSQSIRLLWQQIQQPDLLAGLERQRRILLTVPSGGKLNEQLSHVWFETCTQRLDAMKTVEDALTNELHHLCSQRLVVAEQELADLDNLSKTPGKTPAAEPDFFEDTPLNAARLQATLLKDGPNYGPQVERSILELVQAQAERLQTMSDELDTVRASLHERKTIERAKGLLMAHRQLSENEAHKAMRQMAMNQNKRLVEVAEAVLAMAEILPAHNRSTAEGT